MPYGDLPPALVETYEIPEGVERLRIDVAAGHGSGRGLVEILDPEGGLFRSHMTDCAGAPGVGHVCADWETTVTEEDIPPGTYTVDYRVASALTYEVTITAASPASA